MRSVDSPENSSAQNTSLGLQIALASGCSGTCAEDGGPAEGGLPQFRTGPSLLIELPPAASPPARPRLLLPGGCGEREVGWGLQTRPRARRPDPRGTAPGRLGGESEATCHTVPSGPPGNGRPLQRGCTRPALPGPPRPLHASGRGPPAPSAG